MSPTKLRSNMNDQTSVMSGSFLRVRQPSNTKTGTRASSHNLAMATT